MPGEELEQERSRDPAAAERTERLLRELWPSDFPSPRSEVFAILDGARDQRIHRELGLSTLDLRCLYAGKLPRELIEVAPYLVHLHPHVPYTRRFLDEGWGRSWGICLRARVSLDELRRHFRRFLRVEDERRRGLIFRYYDPRVLRAYLPTCTMEELRTVFGPVECFYVESDAGGALLEFSHDGQKLITRRIPCGA